MTIARTIRHVDAFTTTPLEGNPAAVVDGDGLDDETMQRIALNQHLSETVFLLPPRSPENHAHIRIFTPGTELPFAGHPTIAASHTLISEGTVRAGRRRVAAARDGRGRHPGRGLERRRAALHDDAGVAGVPGQRHRRRRRSPPVWGSTRATSCATEWVSTGIFWLLAQLASLEAMMRVQTGHDGAAEDSARHLDLLHRRADRRTRTSTCARSRPRRAYSRIRSQAAATAASPPSSQSTD